MIRLGLCCTFLEAPIRFRRTTAAAAARRSTEESRRKLAELCLHNAQSLHAALAWCDEHGIGDFRVNSQILPLATHPDFGYRIPELPDLPDGHAIVDAFRACGRFAAERNLRTTFHPDQFVLLGSPREDVTSGSLAEIEYMAEVAEWIGADVINIHGGGAYGDKPAALDRVRRRLDRLSYSARQKLTLENDDRVFTPADLLPICRAEGAPLVYDVHHHRCLADGASIEEASAAGVATWNREPMFHISSPLGGWGSPHPQRHADYIAVGDLPTAWLDLDVTIEVEAKAKESAVLRLRDQLGDSVAG